MLGSPMTNVKRISLVLGSLVTNVVGSAWCWALLTNVKRISLVLGSLVTNVKRISLVLGSLVTNVM